MPMRLKLCRRKLHPEVGELGQLQLGPGIDPVPFIVRLRGQLTQGDSHALFPFTNKSRGHKTTSCFSHQKLNSRAAASYNKCPRKYSNTLVVYTMVQLGYRIGL